METCSNFSETGLIAGCNSGIAKTYQMQEIASIVVVVYSVRKTGCAGIHLFPLLLKAIWGPEHVLSF